MRNPTPWDDVFMEMAHVIAKRSKDPSTQVGAVIVDQSNRIVSLGFNGPPRCVVDSAVNWNESESAVPSRSCLVRFWPLPTPGFPVR